MMTDAPWSDIHPRTPAITVKQPWASHIIFDGKDIENRTWPTCYRGPLLIHAGKSIDAGFDRDDCEDLDFGGLIGVVDLVDCVTASDSGWFHGPIGWVLRNPRPLPFREIRGRLGLWVPPVATRVSA